MTMRRRQQQSRDVFDTGPFGSYNALGNTEGMIPYNGFFYTYAVDTWSVYDSAGTLLETGGASNTNRNQQQAMAWMNSEEEPSYPDEEFNEVEVSNEYQKQQNTYEWGLPTEDIVYEKWMDVWWAHIKLEVIDTAQAKSILKKQFKWRSQYLPSYPGVGDQAYSNGQYDETEFLEQFEAYERANELDAAYSPGKAQNPYVAGEYTAKNVGQALLADEPVLGSKDHYWDGNLDTHDWGHHGISTPIVTGSDGKYPKPIVDSFGGYAMSISHYIASYNQEGGFIGFRVLTASELAGGIPAGIPIATVMQMFTKPAKTSSGVDFDNFTWTGKNFFYDTEKKPIWRKSIGMPMKPKSFFLLEPELATEDKIKENTSSDWIQNTHLFSTSDAVSTFRVGYNSRESVFPTSLGKRDTLDRQFHKGKWGGLRTTSKSKVTFAAQVEWLGDSGAFSAYSKHPTSIPDCDNEGKTMVIYRFPRQLDPVADKKELEFNSANLMPNYEVTTATKYCYPYPGKNANKDEYALIGRLRVGNKTDKNVSSSDTVGADKYTVEINGETFGARQSIKFIPMVSPSMPPSDKHRPYLVSHSQGNGIGEALTGGKKNWFDKTDWFCFDTSSMDGAAITIADPHKTAYFNNSMITNAYFIDRDFDVGSTAFVIGQCMLSYEMDSASIDTKLGLVDASERMILTTRYSNAFGGPINSGDVGQRSDKLQPRSPRDGTNAGKFTDDYLIPTMTMTTEDLVNGTEPIGALAVRDTFKKIFDYELTPEWFGTLRLPNQDPNDPTRYIVDTNYGKFSYPYSIVGFTIPGYYNGPVLRYGEDGKPVGATDEHPGFIGKSKAYVNYQSPFGTLHRHTINFSEEIAIQNQIIDSGGSVTDVYENQTDSDSGAFGEGIEDVTKLKAETIQYEEWLKDRMMQDYGSIRFTNTVFNQHINFFNKDFVTGKMLLEAGYSIPGVDTSMYENEAKYLGIPTTAAELEEEPEPTQVMGLGAFSDASGFTITDVTSKWGAIGSASPRYTGDIGMSMVPYAADVAGEEMGYMAMSNLDGLGYPGEGIVDDAKDFAAEVTLEAAKYSGLGIGLGLGGAAIMLAGGVAVGIAAKGAGEGVWTILNKKQPSPN